MRRLFILRPEPAAERSIAAARALGLDAVGMPLFEVEPVAWSAPDPSPYDGLLLTSANAVLHGGPQLDRLRHLPVYAVGPVTADAARKAGFEVNGEGRRGVNFLLDMINPEFRMVHLCGEDVREPLDSVQGIDPIIVYRSVELPAPAMLGALAGQVAAIHSPRAGKRLHVLLRAADIATASVRLACISSAAADAAGGGWERVEIAERPADELLLALAARLCDKPMTQ